MERKKALLNRLLALILLFSLILTQMPAEASAADLGIENTTSNMKEEVAEDAAQDEQDSSANATVNTETTELIETDKAIKEDTNNSTDTETGLPEGWSPGTGARTANTGTPNDVTAHINFTGGELTNSSGIINEGDGIIFKYDTYTFSIGWDVNFASLGTTLIAGDYFTFQAPKELFANRSLDIKDSFGVLMATLTIDADGNGKVIFNSNVNGLTNLFGELSLGASYSQTSTGVSVDWKFMFENTYQYQGTSEGSTNPSGMITEDNRKHGWQVSSDSRYMSWTARLNLKEEAWTGKVMVEDTLGSDHKMATIFDRNTALYGYYGLTDYGTANAHGSDKTQYYFGIFVIDWDKMREDYNDILDWNRAKGNTKIFYYTGGTNPLDATGTLQESAYTVPDSNLTSGISDFMYSYMSEWRNNSTGAYLYATPYLDGLESVVVTEGGFEIVFPDGALDQTSLFIRYYTELTSPVSPDKVGNTITVSGGDVDDTVTYNASVTIKASIGGTKGKILLYKYDANGTTPLSGVSFTLAESSLSYSSTQETNANGVAEFTLMSSGSSYAGTYTLKEDAAPSGYTLMDDITLTLNSEGEIIAVNGKAVSGGETITDLAGNRICRINSDQLALIVYNQKIVPNYNVTNATATLEGTKTLNGRPLAAGEFEFLLKDSSGNTIEAVQNLADGSFKFATLSYSAEGIYTYTVEEQSGNMYGVQYDSAVYNVTITVTDDGQGTLTAAVSYTKTDGSKIVTNESTIAFENRYSSPDTTIPITLEGKKTLNGRVLNAGEFKFVLKDGSGIVVETVKNQADGTFGFDLSFTEPGIHNYTVEEMNGNLGGITYDTAIYDVIVEIIDNYDGTLSTNVIYKKPDGSTTSIIGFDNAYTAGTADVTLTGSKTLSGKTLNAGMFDFILEDGSGNLIETVTHDGNGNFTFGTLTYVQSDIGQTYTYTVKEDGGGQTANGITYDSTVFTVKVAVIDNGDGTLSTDVTYEADGSAASAIEFENVYVTGTASVTLAGSKTLTGKALETGMFSFVLEDGNGNVIETIKNDKNGGLTFGTITYDQSDAGQTYTYIVKEIDDGAGGITYDNNECTITVDVVDNGDGTLSAVPAYTGSGIVFANSYSTSSTTLSLTGTKNLTGRELADNMFSFIMEDSSGGTAATGTNAADGTITFSDITYTSPGTYNYTISEVDGGAGGITYDSTVYDMTVEVVDNGDGTLTATPTYPDEGLVFNNKYHASSTAVTLAGTKKLKGKTLEAGMFSFIVAEKDGSTAATATNKADGTIIFGEIGYTAPGTYEYTVSEVSGNASGITYDKTTYTVTVEVTDNGDGTLKATVSYPAGGVVFNNQYSATKPTGTTTTSTNKSPLGSSTKTGDNSPDLFLWIFLCFGALVTIAALAWNIRRKRG